MCLPFEGSDGRQGPGTGARGCSRATAGPRSGLDLTSLDSLVQQYRHDGTAPSTHKSYDSGIRRFTRFCGDYNVLSPFPVTENCCYFASALANDGLAPQTIKGYLAAVRSMQISLGLPPLRDQSSLPLLKRVIDGIRRQRAIGGKPTRTRLPITVTVLRRMQGTLSTANNLDGTAFWAIATSAFFGFFRLGELLIKTEAAYHQHLSWGDVAIDDRSAATMVKFHLRKSKCDQFGTGADVLVDRTGCQLYPIAAILAYLKVQGDHPGAFFVDSNRTPIINMHPQISPFGILEMKDGYHDL